MLAYGLNIWPGLLYSEECLLGFCWLVREKVIEMKIIFVQIYFLCYYCLFMFVKVKEFYQNRVDHLYLRTHNMKTGWVTEYFTEGRSHAVKGLTLFCVSTKSSCVFDSGI